MAKKSAKPDGFCHMQNQRTGAAMLCGAPTTGNYMVLMEAGGPPSDSVDAVTCLGCLERLAEVGIVRLHDGGRTVERAGRMRPTVPPCTSCKVPQPGTRCEFCDRPAGSPVPDSYRERERAWRESQAPEAPPAPRAFRIADADLNPDGYYEGNDRDPAGGFSGR